ncbi:MAG: hypothetical protein ACRD68_19145 [Pyrinomonadaceae bacterium]
MAKGQFILDGRKVIPCTEVGQWGHWFMNAERHVGRTEVGPYVVSTVFVGLDYSFGESERPLVFETMVFEDKEEVEREFYATWEEAEAGHARMVALTEQRAFRETGKRP